MPQPQMHFCRTGQEPNVLQTHIGTNSQGRSTVTDPESIGDNGGTSLECTTIVLNTAELANSTSTADSRGPEGDD